VGFAAAVVGDVDAADDEREARLEAVEVEAVADAEREGRRLGLRRRGHGRLVLRLERGRDRQWLLPEAQGRPSGGKRGGGGVGAVPWRGGDGGGEEDG
jgi:hypothetical protein